MAACIENVVRHRKTSYSPWSLNMEPIWIGKVATPWHNFPIERACVKHQTRQVIYRPVRPLTSGYPLRITENILTFMNRQLLRNVNKPAGRVRQVDANSYRG